MLAKHDGAVLIDRHPKDAVTGLPPPAAIIVDGHNDIPSAMLGNASDIATPGPRTHTDLARLKSSGITGEFFSIYAYAKSTNTTLSGDGSQTRIDK